MIRAKHSFEEFFYHSGDRSYLIMNQLEQLIIDRIRKEGPVPFETFMEMALYHPGLGYYSRGDTVIGRGGDFYTSSHLHPVFGAMIARQLMEMWTELGNPTVFHAVEMGAGAGYLCRDILEYMRRGQSAEKDAFLNALRYVIVEPYEHFEKLQRSSIGRYSDSVTWASSLRECYIRQGKDPVLRKPRPEQNAILRQAQGDTTRHPVSFDTSRTEHAEHLAQGSPPNGTTDRPSQGITGCIFSNELLDAFPVHLVEMDGELKEVRVGHDGQRFIEIKSACPADLKNYVKEFSVTLPYGHRTEINLRIRNWLKEVHAVLSEGFVLTIDYGYTATEYYSEERPKGTLLCYHRHQVNEEPYQHIGEQDITAHVNFSSLKKWGEEFNIRTLGLCPQGTFLVAAGIDEVVTELYPDPSEHPFDIARIRGLIFPEGLGGSHSVMAQYRGKKEPGLRGFSLRNSIRQL